MKPLMRTAVVFALFMLPLAGSAAWAAGDSTDKHHESKTTASKTPSDTVNMTDAEVRKVDKDTKKITLKHGEIKNLEMPAMTMVFQVKDLALLDKVKAGDKVKFKAEKVPSGFLLTEIEMAK